MKASERHSAERSLVGIPRRFPIWEAPWSGQSNPSKCQNGVCPLAHR